MRIIFASDHAGFELKEKLISFVKELGHEVEDCGAYEDVEDDDYPDFIKKAALEILKDPDNLKGIILGGSGQGEAVVANRFKNIRAIVYYGGDTKIITLSREHNDANVLSLGARFINEEGAKNVVEIWLNTAFSEDERHVRRIKKIDENG